MWYIWLIASGIFFAIEIATVGFLVFWFGIGALFAMITSFFTDNIMIQFIVFIVVSTILLIFTRPLVNRYIIKIDETKPGGVTNAANLINKRGVVTAEINSIEGRGLVKVNNQVWSAKCTEEGVIPEGTEVEVIKIEGVKLIVTPIN